MSNLQRWGEAHISPSGHLFCKIEAAHLLRVADFFEAPSSSNADETGGATPLSKRKSGQSGWGWKTGD